MGTCTDVGQPGSSISLSDNPLPNGVICNLSGYGQSANGQTAQVIAVNGSVVAQISCSGGPGGPITPMLPPATGLQSFFTPVSTMQPYTVTIKNTGNQVSQVIKAYDSISAGTTTYTGSWVFISEDSPSGGDCDFNDSTVLLSWNLSAG